MSTEMIQAQGIELGGVGGGELVGITDESSRGQDVFDAVLVFGQETGDITPFRLSRYAEGKPLGGEHPYGGIWK